MVENRPDEHTDVWYEIGAAPRRWRSARDIGQEAIEGIRDRVLPMREGDDSDDEEYVPPIQHWERRTPTYDELAAQIAEHPEQWLPRFPDGRLDDRPLPPGSLDPANRPWLSAQERRERQIERLGFDPEAPIGGGDDEPF